MDRCAIVTGVSTGLGEALAIRLVEAGYQVLGIGRRSSGRLAAPRFTLVATDLAQLDALEAALDAALSRLAAKRPVRACLINNAATIAGTGVVGTLTADAIASDFNVNLAAPAVIANAFCRVFADRHCDRRIINVSSGAAQSPIEGAALYSIAKAGLEMLTRAIAADHATDGLRAVTLRPGILDTRMQAALRGQRPERLPSVAMFRDFHASGRLVAPDEVAAKVVTHLVEGRIENGRTYTAAEL